MLTVPPVYAAHLSSPTELWGLDPLDWFLILLIGASTFMAFFRGLVRSLVSLVAVVLGILLAAWYMPTLARVLLRWVPEHAAAEILAFLLILAGVCVAAWAIGHALRTAIRAVGLGFFDRLGGAAFGFARAVVVLAAALIPAAPFLHSIPFAKNSLLLPYLQTAAHGVSFVMPQDFSRRFLTGTSLETATRRSVQRHTARHFSFEGEAQ